MLSKLSVLSIREETKVTGTGGRGGSMDDKKHSVGCCAVLCIPSFCNPNIALPMCWESITDLDLFNFSVREGGAIGECVRK